MAVREKVALLFSIAIVLLAIKHTDSTKNMAKRARHGVKQGFNINTTVQGAGPWTKPKNPGRVSKPNQQGICEKFNFPEIQYPSATASDTPLFHDFENKDTRTLKGTQPHHRLDKRRRNRKLKTKQSIQGNAKGPEFSSAPSYRDVGTFPDVEYPLNNKDVWRPNYWNCPPKTFSPSTNITSKSRRRGVHSTLNTKSKKSYQVSPARLFDFAINTRIDPSKDDNKQVELPTKKRSHDQLTQEPLFDNSNTATPIPYLSQEMSALRTKLATNIAQKAVSLIKDKLNSRISTEPTFQVNDKDLEDILCLPRNNNSNSTKNNQTVNDAIDTNTTDPAINMFTAFTESPEHYKLNLSNEAFETDSTSLLPLNDNTGSHNTNRSIVEHDISDKRVNNETNTDNVSNESEDYTTDDPSDNYVLSTISPIDDWKNTDIIDPYRSVSCPDELEVYYIAVT